MILPRRVLPQPKPEIYAGGDCGACVLAGLLRMDIQNVYADLCEATQPLSWTGMKNALWKAKAHGLLDRLVKDVPIWSVAHPLQIWGSPSWQQNIAWFNYVRMALDGEYYAVATVDSNKCEGSFHSGVGWVPQADHWVLIVGERQREEHNKQIKEVVTIKNELLLSNSSTQMPSEEWVDHRDFLRLWGGFNVLLARPSSKD